jgi:hypothetical protein
VAHSIELLLDPDSEAHIRSIWSALAQAGLPSQARVTSATNRPHVTLLAARRISPEVDEVLRPLATRFPVACVVGAPLVFGGPTDRQRRSASAVYTLARIIVPSAELLALHGEVYRLSLPYLIGEPFGHCRPGRWTAHATLGRRFTAEDVGLAMTVVHGKGIDLSADVTGLRRWDSDERVDHLLVG